MRDFLLLDFCDSLLDACVFYARQCFAAFDYASSSRDMIFEAASRLRLLLRPPTIIRAVRVQFFDE